MNLLLLFVALLVRCAWSCELCTAQKVGDGPVFEVSARQIKRASITNAKPKASYSSRNATVNLSVCS